MYVTPVLLYIMGEHGITKTCLFKYTENFTTKKWKIWYILYFCSKTLIVGIR